MQLISEVMTAGVLENLAERPESKPAKKHQDVAKAVIAVGGYGQPLNRAQRRAIEAKTRKAARKQVKA